MNKHLRWLGDQLGLWVARGLISAEQAERIRQFYPEAKAGLPWGMILFSGLGATIVGLGVILLFAYNWNVMPKEVKLAVVFAALLGAHAGGLALWRQSDGRRQLGEALFVLGTMMFGAGIWLVAQIYHIDEHFPNGFLIWGIGALAMGWGLPSAAQALLATAVLCIWNGSESWSFRTPVSWAPLLLLLGPVALATWMKSRWLLGFALAGFSFSVVATTSALHEAVLVPVVMGLSAGFVGLMPLIRWHTRFVEAAPVWGFFGWLGFLFCSYLLTFHGIVDDLLGWRTWREPTRDPYVAWIWVAVAMALGVATWACVAWEWWRGSTRARGDCAYENWMVPLAAIASLIFWSTNQPGMEPFAAGVFNVVCLAMAAAWMARGCREADLSATVWGSVLLAALALGRYFDLFDSLIARGLVFVFVGGLLIVEGWLYTRARRRLTQEVAP